MSKRPSPQSVCDRDRSRTASLLPGRVLVDLPNWLGDFVMALPATDRIVTANRGGTTFLHVRPSTARLAAELFPDAMVVATPRREPPLRTIRRFRRLDGPIDVGLTLRNAARAKIVLRLTSKWSAGTVSQGGRHFLGWTWTPEHRRHQLHDADALLTHLGLETADPRWRAELPPESAVFGRRVLDGVGLDAARPVVGLAPGVAWGGSAKRWPENSFGRLGAVLKSRGFEPVVIIGPGEEDLADRVVKASGFEMPVVAGDLDAAGLAAVLGRLAALVGNDSGPAHLASALGVMTLALFGPTDEGRTAPMYPEGTVIRRPMACAPCGRTRCPMDHKACMVDLDPTEVFEEILVRTERTVPVAAAVQA